MTLKALAGALAEVPPPPRLDQLDSSVRELYQQRRQQLEKLQDDDTRKDGKARKELAAAYGALGDWHFAYRLFDGALLAYTHAVTLEPLEPRWLFLKASVEVERGENLAARKVLVRALDLDPLNSEITIAIARLDLAEARPASAAQVLAGLVEIEPHNAVALLLNGQAAYQQDQIADAIEVLERALQAAPRATDVRYALAVALRDAGQLARAETLLAHSKSGRNQEQPATTPSPWMSRVFALRAGVRSAQRRGAQAYRQGRFEEALQHFTEAALIAPENPLPHFNRWLTMIELKQTKAARAEQAVLLRLAPQHPQFYHLSGLLELAEGMPQEALESFQTAVQTNPSFTAARLELAKLLFQTGAQERGRKQFAEVIERQPENSAARVQWLRAESYNGDLSTACDLLPAQPAGALSSEMANAMARLLSVTPGHCGRDVQQAVQLARLVFKGNNSVEHAETLAMAQAALGNFERAAKVQAQILRQLGPSHENDNATTDASTAVNATDLDRVQERLRLYERNQLPAKPWTAEEMQTSASITRGLPLDQTARPRPDETSGDRP